MHLLGDEGVDQGLVAALRKAANLVAYASREGVLSIRLPAMPNPNHQNLHRIIVYLIDNAVVANTNAPSWSTG